MGLRLGDYAFIARREKPSIAACRIDPVQQRAAFRAAPDVVEDDRGRSERIGDAGDVRGDHDPRVPPERVPRRQRLVAEDVERRGRKLTPVERRDQILFDEMGAAAGIDQAGACRQEIEGAGIEDLLGFAGQRQEADEDFRSRE